MREMRRTAVAVASLLLGACAGGETGQGPDGLSVLVSIQPQGYFVQRIAGDRAEVTVLIPPGASPAAYEMSPSEMRAVSRGDVWFSIGVTAENPWQQEFPSLNPDLMAVSTVDGIERLPIDRYGVPGEEHDSGHDHSHGGTDPHVWLSPELVKEQATVIAETLVNIDPDNAGLYMENLESFTGDISALQEELRTVLEPHAGSSFMVFHPAWGYFADEFDLVQVPIEIAGSEPSPREMALLMDHAGEEGIGVVFVSPQFSTSSAETIAQELGASVVVIDPLAADWLANMRMVAGELARSLE